MVGTVDGLTEKKELVMEKDDAIYLAGLFDGEGCVYFKYRYRRRKGRSGTYAWCNELVCRLQLEMSCKETIDHVKNITKCGTVWMRKPRRSSLGTLCKQMYIWVGSHRDANKVAKYITPFAITKQNKLLEIVNHYVN